MPLREKTYLLILFSYIINRNTVVIIDHVIVKVEKAEKEANVKSYNILRNILE